MGCIESKNNEESYFLIKLKKYLNSPQNDFTSHIQKIQQQNIGKIAKLIKCFFDENLKKQLYDFIQRHKNQIERITAKDNRKVAKQIKQFHTQKKTDYDKDKQKQKLNKKKSDISQEFRGEQAFSCSSVNTQIVDMDQKQKVLAQKQQKIYENIIKLRETKNILTSLINQGQEHIALSESQKSGSIYSKPSTVDKGQNLKKRPSRLSYLKKAFSKNQNKTYNQSLLQKQQKNYQSSIKKINQQKPDIQLGESFRSNSIQVQIQNKLKTTQNSFDIQKLRQLASKFQRDLNICKIELEKCQQQKKILEQQKNQKQRQRQLEQHLKKQNERNKKIEQDKLKKQLQQTKKSIKQAIVSNKNQIIVPVVIQKIKVQEVDVKLKAIQQKKISTIDDEKSRIQRNDHRNQAKSILIRLFRDSKIFPIYYNQQEFKQETIEYRTLLQNIFKSYYGEEKYSKMPIHQTNLIYSYDPKQPKRFYDSVKDYACWMIVVKINDNLFIGGFVNMVNGLKNPTPQSFLFSLAKGKHEAYVLKAQKPITDPIIKSDAINFGNAQLFIKGQTKKIEFNFNPMTSYFCQLKGRTSNLRQFSSNKSELQYQSYQIHEIEFREPKESE